MKQTVTSTTTKGFVIGLILIILALVVYFANIKVSGPAQWIGYVVFIGGIIWSVNSYGKQINYNSTFGNYFAHGFKVSAVVTVLMIIYVIIFSFLFPDFKETAMEEARKSMQAKDNLTPDQISQGLEITRKFFLVFLIGGTLVGYLIFGAIASLIGAGITKKAPNKIVEDINQIGQ
jgi:Protein of unknown function (DUF4199)